MTIINTLVIVAPFAWSLGWLLAVRAMAQQPKNWRARVSIAALGLLTAVGLFWFPVAMYGSGVDGSNGAGLDEHIRNVQTCSKFAVRSCAAVLVLGFFGKPRLIVPITLACVGAALFWYFTAYMY